MGEAEPPTALADRELIERHVARVIVKPQALEVCLIPTCEASAQAEDPGLDDPAPCHPPTTTITLPWTAPSFAAVKGIVHAPCAKPAMKARKPRALCSPPSPRPGDGSTTSGSAALLPSPRLPSVRSRANGTSACSLPSPSCRLASLRRSSMAPRLRTSRSPASPRPCPIPGSSRSGASDCDVSPATNARRHRSRRRNRLKQTPNQRQPSRSRNASHVGQRVYRSCGLRAGVRLTPQGLSCEPVSVCNRTGLRPAEREIEKWRPETGAQNPPRTDRNTENYRPETGIRQPNPRECRRFSPTGK